MNKRSVAKELMKEGKDMKVVVIKTMQHYSKVIGREIMPVSGGDMPGGK